MSRNYPKAISSVPPSSALSDIDSDVSKLTSQVPESSISPFKTTLISSADIKTLVAKLTGVGYVNLPKDIKKHKRIVSFVLYLMFIFSSVLNGFIFYGIEMVVNDTCFSPTQKTEKSLTGPYQCFSYPGGFIKQEQKIYIRLFEIGSTLTTISLGLGASGIYYLNFKIVFLYLIFFLSGLTLMIFSLGYEILIGKTGVLSYLSIPSTHVYGYMVYFFIEVINLLAIINIEFRWINYLNT